MPQLDWDAIRGKANLDPNKVNRPLSDFWTVDEVMAYIDEQKKSVGPRLSTEFNIDHPPVKFLPYQEFPKMLYRHPQNRTLPDVTLIVNNAQEQKQAQGNGFTDKPHAHEPQCQSVKEYADQELRCEWHEGHYPGTKHRSGRRIWTDDLVDIEQKPAAQSANTNNAVRR